MSVRRLRADLPFERPAVVLSGGGALGAYQVGVLKVLRAVGLRPAIVSGVSVGAMNAVGWVAQGFETPEMERTWLGIGPSSIGMRWTLLILRLAGALVVAWSALEIVVTLFGTADPGLARMLFHHEPASLPPSWVFDVVAWLLVGISAGVLAKLAPRAETWLANATAAGDPDRWQRVFGNVIAGLAALHLSTWMLGLPFPHRFSATVLIFALIAWVANRQGRSGHWLRRALVRLLPESGGRGLWRGIGRRRILFSMIAEGDAGRLQPGGVRLLVPAFAVDTGRMVYFVNWPPDDEFREMAERALAEVVTLSSPNEMLQAAAASSAIPVLFQPVRLHGREFVDASLFSSQIVRATVAAGADALVVVLMSPGGVPMPRGTLNLFEVGSRFLDLGSWRDLRTELGLLAESWRRETPGANVCVVEPDTPLPGALLHFEPREAVHQMRRGEQDAWQALERAGWLEPVAD